MNKRQLIIVAIGIAILALAFLGMQLLAGFKKLPPSTPQKAPTRFVKAEEVKYQNIKSGFMASGRVSSQKFVDLIAEVQGKLLPGSVQLKVGESFRRGDVLVRIYAEEAELAIQARKSRFLNSIANILPDFRIDFNESHKTWTNFFDAIDIKKPLPELPEIKSQQEKIYLAGRNILSDYYTIKSEEIRLKKHQLTAPFNGTFTEVMFEVGAVANPGTRIARMIQTDQLEIEVPVKIEMAKWVHLNDPVKLYDNVHNTTFNGRIGRISDFVNPKTQSVSVYINLNYSEFELYQGQYLEAEFPGKTIENVMEIPRSAVFNFNEVYTVEEGKLKKNIIEIVKMNENTVLFSGIPEGRQIVTEALVNANENMLVKTIE